MSPDDLVETIRTYWLMRGYDGVRVWWENIENKGVTRVPRAMRFRIKSNIVDGYPPRDKEE